jgi:hypothetical protein
MHTNLAVIRRSFDAYADARSVRITGHAQLAFYHGAYSICFQRLLQTRAQSDTFLNGGQYTIT